MRSTRGVSETAIIPAAKKVLDRVAESMKKDPEGKIAVVGYADGEAVGSGKNREQRCYQVAAQRAVNAKAYLIKQHGIDAGRILPRVGMGQSGVASIILLPESTHENQAAEVPGLQGTSPVDENVTKPLESDLQAAG